MSLRVKFRFDGKCSLHPRYNPETDGRPQNASCQGCDGLYVIHLYTHIARKKAEKAEGLIVRQSRANLKSDAEFGDVEQGLPGSTDYTASE